MKNIQKVKYKNPVHKDLDFEIVTIEDFFKTRSKKHLEKESRIDFWFMMYISQGSGLHYIDFKEYSYKEDDIVLIQKNQVQRFLVTEEVKGYIVIVNEPFFYEDRLLLSKSFLDFFDVFYRKPLLESKGKSNSLNRDLIEMIYKTYHKDIEDKDKILKSLFQSFILSIGKIDTYEGNVESEKYYSILKEFRHHVEENFMEVKSVEEYSLMMNMSKKTINKATRLTIDKSPKEIIIDRIILEIKRYLAQGDYMNYEISNILGFSEPANMTKFFKKHVGISPKEFKESI